MSQAAAIFQPADDELELLGGDVGGQLRAQGFEVTGVLVEGGKSRFELGRVDGREEVIQAPAGLGEGCWGFCHRASFLKGIMPRL